jgi:hypothetical protein
MAGTNEPRGPIHALIHALYRTRAHTRALAPAVADTLDRVRAVTGNLIFNSVRDLDSVLARARDVAVVLVSTVEHALDLALDLTQDIDRTLDLALDLTRDIDRTLDLALGLTRDIDRMLDHDRDRTLDRILDLDRTLTRAQDRARELETNLASFARYAAKKADDEMPPAQPMLPVAMSRQLMCCAIRLLPTRDRKEYDEIFRSELADFVANGYGWSRQVLHALRVLLHAPLLRHELRTPAPAERERA